MPAFFTVLLLHTYIPNHTHLPAFIAVLLLLALATMVRANLEKKERRDTAKEVERLVVAAPCFSLGGQRSCLWLALYDELHILTPLV